jgi:hypothetical protein
MSARPLDRSAAGQPDAGRGPSGQWNTEQGTSGEHVSGEGMINSDSVYDRSTTDVQQDAADWEPQRDTNELG